MSHKLFNDVMNVADTIKDGRTSDDVFQKLMEEVGELVIEMRILKGAEKPTKGGDDGYRGEIQDCIITLLDLQYRLDTETGRCCHDILDMEKTYVAKLQKWLSTKQEFTNGSHDYIQNTLRKD